MKTILTISLLALLASCCPKIGTQVSVTSDTVYVRKDTTITLPPITITDTINMTSFCDSLLKGFAPKINRKVTGGQIKIIADTTGKAEINCETDSLKRIIKILQTEIITAKESVTVRLPRWYNFFKYGFLYVSAILLLTLFVVVVKNKV